MSADCSSIGQSSFRSRHRTRLLSNPICISVWPLIFTTILASLIILCVVVIGILEIVSLANSTDTDLFGNTSSTGAGFWCRFIFVIATVLRLYRYVYLKTA